MQKRGEQFEEIFNRIDRYLRRTLVAGDKRSSFASVLRDSRSNPTVRRYYDDLLELADLRNAIVHSRGTTSKFLADPRQEALTLIAEIEERLTRPPLLGNVMSGKRPHIFPPEDPLKNALLHMKENDYSQIVVSTGNEYGIVSAEGISRWLESNVNDDVISILDQTIASVVPHEPDDSVAFMSRKNKVDELLERIKSVSGPRLFCVLVTENGKPSAKPIGIFTPWDVVKLN